MTIVASVKVRDGLILATDSMSHVHGTAPDGSQQFLKAYENARKLFQVGGLPIGVMSYGLGNVGQRSIEGLMLDFGGRIGNRRRVEAVTQALFDFVSKQYKGVFRGVSEPPPLGFYVAGYSPREPFPEEREFLLPVDCTPGAARAKNIFGASWRGIDFPFTRLWKGYDPRLAERLQQKGMSVAEIEQLTGDLEAPVVYDGMPVQDAINFATYILTATIGYTGFSIGVPACGGPLQVATVLADRGFEWVARPDLRLSVS